MKERTHHKRMRRAHDAHIHTNADRDTNINVRVIRAHDASVHIERHSVLTNT
jgi:hypothetical protein